MNENSAVDRLQAKREGEGWGPGAALSLGSLVVSFCVVACGSGSAEPASSSGGSAGTTEASTSTSTSMTGTGGASTTSITTVTSSSTSGVSATGSGGAGGVGGAGTGGAPGDDAITPPAGYDLVWHDEFNIDGAPDPASWKFEKGFVRNQEAQWYQADNASTQGGFLVIEARKETVQNPNYTGTGDWKTTRKTAQYTSSSLNTSGLRSWQYGRFEMRARIPTKAGMWPAWWTLGVSGEWPSNGEIDIMEFYQSKLLANVACGTATQWQAKWDSTATPLSSFAADWASSFHVWRMDWDDQSIDLYVDDQKLNSSALSSMLNADGKSPFKQKAYMLLNLAIGGNNGGDPAGTPFPQRYEIDYVRVFQKH